jgi:glycine/sarcosine N-methyltransferase
MLSINFDDIATDFDKLFNDVDALTDLEGQALDLILRPYAVKTVLDCACGTGIQSIGLARKGYQVSASDISRRMVKKLREKAQNAQLQMDVKVADFRDLKPWKNHVFDAVISSGNSLTLMATHEEMKRSLASMLRCIKKPGGICVVGMHNYLWLQQNGEPLIIRKVSLGDKDLELIFDLRRFESERAVVTNFFMKQINGTWRLKNYTKSYSLLPVEELRQMMIDTGFTTTKLLDISGQKEYDDNEWVLAVGEI